VNQALLCLYIGLAPGKVKFSRFVVMCIGYIFDVIFIYITTFVLSCHSSVILNEC